MSPNEIAMRVLNLSKKMRADLRLNPRVLMYLPADRIRVLLALGVAGDRAQRIGMDQKLYTLFIEALTLDRKLFPHLVEAQIVEV